MSHDSSRKSFLAKVLGLTALGVAAPRVVAAALTPPPARPAGGFQLRPDARAVGRPEVA